MAKFDKLLLKIRIRPTMKNLDYYLSLPYTILLSREDEATWFARVLELPGCMTEGDSAAEAVEMIQDAMSGWLEVALEDRAAIPEPRFGEDYSGKFVVRVPKSLHRDLALAAEREGASLNQFINTALARAVGRAEPVQPEIGFRKLPDLIIGVERLLHKLENGSALAWDAAGEATPLSSLPSLALHEPSAAYQTGADKETPA